MAKKKKKLPLIYKICSFLLIAVTLFLIGSIIYLNVLNIILLSLLIGILFIIVGFNVLLTLKSKKKKTGFFISSILILIFGLLSFYINKTTGLLNNLNLNVKTYNYSVVVLKNSPYEKIKDINNKSIGYFNDGSTESKKALNKILNKIELENDAYEDTHELANSLLDKKNDAILIEDSYLDILNESFSKDGKNFKDEIRKIYSFVIVTKTNDISKDINVTKEPFHIYVSGIDTYGEISSVSRSDVNMVVSVNPDTRQILLTSIPRDYYVQLHGKSGYKDKLTHAGLYGTDMSIQTIEDLLDIEINYYVKVNFSSIIKIVDAIDGVNVYSDYNFTSIDNYHYTKGYNEVNGEEALSFVRKAFALGDRQRVKNQQALLQAIFDKCMSKTIITKYTKLLESIEGSFVTNMKMSRLTSLIKLQISENYSWNLISNSLTGTDASNYTYSAPSQKAYVMEPDEESLFNAIKLLNDLEIGEILNKESSNKQNGQVNKVTKEDSNSNKNTSSSVTKNEDYIDDEILEAKLIKNSITFTLGDEYIYHGYSLMYNGEEVSDIENVIEKFSINNKVYDNYKDLVLYVSNLDSGTYQIMYTIQYKEKTVILNQEVIIKENNIITEETEDEDDAIIDVKQKEIEDEE